MFTVRDYQGRVNGIFNDAVLVVDGINGPKTRKGIADAMRERGVRRKQDLFDRGVRGVVWHWTAGANGLIELELNAYNFLHDTIGRTYDGNHTIAEQVRYDWRKGIGASHTRKMNTGWVGCSVDAMAGSKQANPMQWGSHPITWDGIDAMLEQTADICEEYEVPISKWTTLSHAEVQPTLGVKQKWKWDYTVLPGEINGFQDPVEIGDKLRARMLEKFV
ncbi:hypothetical protein RDp07_gp65 [Roseobacter phage RD-1410Ws-07]|uniref:N-acetylmuramoyl-L-alanine amidase n=2 Tax=Sanyabayvirus DS1410Ws06 TaxID=2844087 RepID=A0A191VYU0_9CAUD|nr:endolysin [Dinoroseobacter phage DS-1410Ws-06]ANJ20725.1 hypothetical protein DSp06_gp68 [Dinoroseobacter phage DS-1410Ws-06]ANJ20876.1 hypothetical protein RDp07_gp65 [Roseobacter phage RD-1410Ws-07]